MKLNYKNIKLSFYIIRAWLKSFAEVIILPPSSYLDKLLYDGTSQRPLTRDEWKTVRKVVKGVGRLSPIIVKKRKCLMEALIVLHSLEKIGIPSVLKLGTKKGINQLEAHAWVSINDVVVIGGPVSDFEELIKTH